MADDAVLRLQFVSLGPIFEKLVEGFLQISEQAAALVGGKAEADQRVETDAARAEERVPLDQPVVDGADNAVVQGTQGLGRIERDVEVPGQPVAGPAGYDA